MNVARIWRVPEKDSGRILIREHWGVDNFHETSTADTKDQAVKLAVKLWRVDEVFVVTGNTLMDVVEVIKTGS